MSNRLAEANTEFLGKGQVRALSSGQNCSRVEVFVPTHVRPRLIPALHCSSDRAHNDCDVQLEWVTPTVRSLISQKLLFVLVQLLQALEIGWILSYQSAFLEQLELIIQTLLMCELLDISHEVYVRDSRQRIADSVRPSANAGDM